MKIGLRKAYLLASQFYYTYEGCIFTEKPTEELDRGAICEPFSDSVSPYSQEFKYSVSFIVIIFPRTQDQFCQKRTLILRQFCSTRLPWSRFCAWRQR